MFSESLGLHQGVQLTNLEAIWNVWERIDLHQWSEHIEPHSQVNEDYEFLLLEMDDRSGFAN